MTRRKIIALIVGAAVVLTAFLIVVSGILPYRVFIVHTGSMEPAISSRSAVIVHRHVYRVGQPISFSQQGGVVTHRLVRVNSDGTAVTKGDANTTADPWTIKTSAIIGGVIAAPPELGYWLMYLKNPFGLMSVLLAAVVCWQLLSLGEHDCDPDGTPAKRRFWRRTSTRVHAAADHNDRPARRAS
jgi:signal peptidase